MNPFIHKTRLFPSDYYNFNVVFSVFLVVYTLYDVWAMFSVYEYYPAKCCLQAPFCSIINMQFSIIATHRLLIFVIAAHQQHWKMLVHMSGLICRFVFMDFPDRILISHQK